MAISVAVVFGDRRERIMADEHADLGSATEHALALADRLGRSPPGKDAQGDVPRWIEIRDATSTRLTIAVLPGGLLSPRGARR